MSIKRRSFLASLAAALSVPMISGVSAAGQGRPASYGPQLSFSEFIQEAWPHVNSGGEIMRSPSMDLMVGEIERLGNGEINRLSASVSYSERADHGKERRSFFADFWPERMAWHLRLLTTAMYPAWRMSIDPSAFIWAVSRNEGNAIFNEHLFLELAGSQWYQSMWPEVGVHRRDGSIYGKAGGGYLPVAVGSVVTASRRPSDLVCDRPCGDVKQKAPIGCEEFAEWFKAQIHSKAQHSRQVIVEPCHYARVFSLLPAAEKESYVAGDKNSAECLWYRKDPVSGLAEPVVRNGRVVGPMLRA